MDGGIHNYHFALLALLHPLVLSDSDRKPPHHPIVPRLITVIDL